MSYKLYSQLTPEGKQAVKKLEANMKAQKKQLELIFIEPLKEDIRLCRDVQMNKEPVERLLMRARQHSEHRRAFFTLMSSFNSGKEHR